MHRNSSNPLGNFSRAHSSSSAVSVSSFLNPLFQPHHPLLLPLLPRYPQEPRTSVITEPFAARSSQDLLREQPQQLIPSTSIRIKKDTAIPQNRALKVLIKQKLKSDSGPLQPDFALQPVPRALFLEWGKHEDQFAWRVIRPQVLPMR